MSERKLTLESLAWLLVLLLAAWTRLASLDRIPLDDAEAGEALAAAASGGSPSAFWRSDRPTTNPSYHALTALVFAAFGPSDGLARLVPALAGVALVMTPLLMRRAIGRAPALGAGLVLLLSPTALTVARTASGAPLAALGWSIAAAALMYRDDPPARRAAWAGAAAGLALASGTHALMGLFTLLAGWLLFALWVRRQRSSAAGDRRRRSRAKPLDWQASTALTRGSLRSGALLGAIILVGLASGVGLFPSGLPGLFEGAAAWVRGWERAGGTRLLPYLAMFPLYEPLILWFGLAGAWLATRGSEPRPRGELAWALAAGLAPLFYAGRSAQDLIWAVLPLAVLAGRAVAALLEGLQETESWPAVGGFGVACVLLVCYAALQLAGYANSLDIQLDFALRLGLAALGLVLALLALLFLGWGWSWRSAVQAGGLAGLLLAAGVAFSSGWRLNFLQASAGDLWRSQANTAGLRLLGRSVRTISQAQTGRTDALPLELTAVPPAGLAWELRGFKPVTQEPLAAAPQLVLTPEGEQPPALHDDYLGQSFAIAESRDWSGGLPPDFLRWLVDRQAPTEAERWLLMVRSDLAGAGELTSQESGP